MEKVLLIRNLDCPNCALKLERKLKRIKGLESVEVNFLAQKIKISGSEEVFADEMNKIRKICKMFDDCEIIGIL